MKCLIPGGAGGSMDLASGKVSVARERSRVECGGVVPAVDVVVIVGDAEHAAAAAVVVVDVADGPKMVVMAMKYPPWS